MDRRNGVRDTVASRYAEWADALNVGRREFVKKMIFFTEPGTYAILFGDAVSYYPCGNA